MATESGFTNQKKIGLSQFKTIHDVGSDKFAENVVTKGLIERQNDNIAISAIDLSEDSQLITLEIIGHGSLRKGEVLRFYTGALSDCEIDIVEVISEDILVIQNVMDVLPSIGDEVRTAYYRTPQFDVSGNIITNSGPVQFVQDGDDVEVESDSTTPANNKPLPAGLYIIKDGVIYPVAKDTTNPANTVAIPVELNAISGPINVTAGDLNVQLTDLGANFDALRVGDGTGNYLKINADGSIATNDSGVLAALEALAEIDFASETTLSEISGKVSTEAKQDAAITALGNLLTELEKKADLTETQPVSISALPLPAGGATSANQDSEIAALGSLLTELEKKADLTETQPVSAASLPLPAGAATSAKQDDTITKLEEMRVILNDIRTLSNRPILNTCQNQIVSTGADTLFTMPVGAKMMQISNNAADIANPVRWTPAAQIPSSTVGAVLIPTAPAQLVPAGNIRVLAIGGDADVTVTYYT